ncbi:hypothetical protein I3I95_02900 [bacterium]|nr:hypothetical protein [bacterium]
MTSRLLLILGLSFMWPFIRNVKSFVHAGAPEGSYTTLSLAFYGSIIASALVIAGLCAHAHRRQARPRREARAGALAAGLGVLASVALLASCQTPGAPLASQVCACVVVGAYFSVAMALWTALALRAKGEALTRLSTDAAISFALGIVLAYVLDLQVVTRALGTFALAPRALYPAVSGCLLGALLVARPATEAPAERAVRPLSRREAALVAAVVALCMCNALLLGLHRAVAITAGGSDYLNRLGPVSILLALALLPCLAYASRWRRSEIVSWGVVLLVTAAGAIMSAALDSMVSGIGADVIYVSKLAVWVLFWLLVIDCTDTAPSAVSLLCLVYLPIRGVTNGLTDLMGRLDVASSLSPVALYAFTITVALALIVSAAAIVLLLVEHTRRPAAAVVAVKPAAADAIGVARLVTTPDELRHAACVALGGDRGLTGRELETLEELSRGFTVQRIAESQTVSENTVRTHVKAVYRKLGCHTKQEVIDLVEARMRKAMVGRDDEASSPATTR